MERNSFVKALLRAHTVLLEDLGKLEEAIQPSSGEDLPELRTRLGATLKHVTRHFRFEEQNGYLLSHSAAQEKAGERTQQEGSREAAQPSS